MKTSLFVGAAVTALLVSSSAFADKQHYTGVITNAAELTAHTTTICATEAAGCSFTFTYDTVSRRICGHALLESKLNIKAAHIHQGDQTTPSGGVIVDFGLVGETSTDQLTVDVVAPSASDPDFAAAHNEADDTESHIYFNIHTTEDPNGAVRANIHPDVTHPDLDECLELDNPDGGATTTDGGGPTTTPTDGGGNTVDGGSDTSTGSSDSSSSCSTAPGTSPGSVLLMLGAAIAVGSIVRARKKR